KRLVLDGDEGLMARAATVPGLGGTGALRIGAEFLRYTDGLSGRVLISAPTWENHLTIFGRTGFDVGQYRYYTPDGPDIEGMLADLNAAASGTVVVLHACCHNPTGEDLAADQWARVADVVEARGLVPFLDMAYQGFSQGLAEDRVVVDLFAGRGLPVLVANSFSKTFSLYGERVGGLTVIAADADEAKRVMSQLKVCVRTLYSNPPTHGAQVVSMVLADPELRARWEAELTGMRLRIKAMRHALASGLVAAGMPGDTSFIERQVGMFSYTGLSADQMRELRERHHVYGLNTGRICVAALNDGNLGRVCQAIAAVA
ncbi:MAG: aromatic amino acid transaminase, partial [Micrococcales bacterium]|nr:aromatic amino acid transaminase [Micrococcales bacterium]